MEIEETSEQTDASELTLETLIILESGLSRDLTDDKMGAGGKGNIVLVLDLFVTIEKVLAVEKLDVSDTEEVGLVDLTSAESALVSVKDDLV